MQKQFLLFLALLATIGSQAQFEIRPFTGMNFTDVSKSPSGTDTQAKLGGQIGASVLIGKKLHLMPGIAFFSQNTAYSSTANGGGTNNEFDQTVNGVQIPLLLGYRFVDAGTDPFFNLRLFAGPALQFLTKTTISNGQVNEQVDWSENSWQAMFGLGLDIKFIFIDAGYSWGLSNTATSGNGGLGIGDFRSNTFLVNVGVRLNLAN